MAGDGPSSAVRSRGSRTALWSSARGVLRRMFRSRISCTCAWSAPTHAHGRIVAIDTAKARARPRRHRAVDGGRCRRYPADRFPPDARLRALSRTGSRSSPQIVCAMSASRWRLSLRPIPTPPKTPPIWSRPRSKSCRKCLSADAPPAEFSAGHSTEAAIVRKGYGDVAAAFAARHAIVTLELKIGRHSGVPLETRGAIARYDAARDVLELIRRRQGAALESRQRSPACSAAPLLPCICMKATPAAASACAANSIRRTCSPVSAHCGSRRPVKWIEDRREHLIATNHSREQHYRVRAAVDQAGRLLAIDGEFFHDQGAYVRTHAATVPDLAATMLLGPYRVGAYRMIGRIRLTNKTPCGTYRAPGRFESTFVRERLMDAIAARLGLDPIEVRRRNLIAATEMPYARHLDTLGTDMTYDSGDYAGLLDKALAAADWQALREDLKRRRAGGEAVGAGLAMFVEKSGLGPFDCVHAAIDSAGTVEIVTGATSVGQGMETVLAQICADALGVDYRQVRVVHGQTDRIAYGMGTFASRVTVMTGEATRIAAAKLRAKAIAAAADLLQSPPEALDIVDGNVVRKDAAQRTFDNASATSRARSIQARSSSATRHPGLAADGWFESQHI